MPYREKIAWLMLIALPLTLAAYVALLLDLAPGLGRAPTDSERAAAFVLLVFAQAVVIGLGRLALRLTSPADARLPLDERDSAIARRAVSAAYYVLISGTVVAGAVSFNSRGWGMVNVIVSILTLAELVHYGVTVVSYRRQA